MKAIGIIIFTVYIAFCATLYFAGSEKKFSDPFVAVAGNATSSVPGNSTASAAQPTPTPEPSSKPRRGSASRKAADDNSSVPAKRTPAKTTPAKPK